MTGRISDHYAFGRVNAAGGRVARGGAGLTPYPQAVAFMEERAGGHRRGTRAGTGLAASSIRRSTPPAPAPRTPTCSTRAFRSSRRAAAASSPITGRDSASAT